jgi:hypothetical protein
MEITKGFNMKLRLDEIARELKNKGLSSGDDLTEGLLEILEGKDLFLLLADEMSVIEDEEKSEKMTYLDYLEKIGEV